MDWKFEQKVDLKQPSRALFVTDPLMVEGDNLAHEWRVHVFTGGQPMDLTGYTITGYFDRSDGKMVPVIGTADGSLATVVLPQSVYAAPGPLTGLLRAGKDGQVITLAAGHWTVRRGPGDEIVDPGHVVPSLEELLAKIGEMEEKTNAASSAASSANTAASNATAAALRLSSVDVDLTVLPPNAEPTASAEQTDTQTTFRLGLPRSNYAYAAFEVDENMNLLMSVTDEFDGISFALNDGVLEVTM